MANSNYNSKTHNENSSVSKTQDIREQFEKRYSQTRKDLMTAPLKNAIMHKLKHKDNKHRDKSASKKEEEKVGTKKQQAMLK